jgi:hypothetical protein
VSNPYDQASGAPPNDTLGTVSAVCGVLSLLGTGCCCIPLINYIAMLVFPLTMVLMIVGLVTGFMGRSNAAATGGNPQMANIGLGASIGAIVLFLAIMALQIVLGGGLMILSILGGN